MFSFFKKKKNNKNPQSITNFFCPQCKREQTLPSNIVYDFTKGKNSHSEGETLFVCTNCGTLMKPKKKEEV